MARAPDPRYGNIHLDANALEPPDLADRELVAKFQVIVERSDLSIVNPHGVQREIDDPRTPDSTKEAMRGIFTLETDLVPEEISVRAKLRDLMRGNAAPGKHEADADHIFEAQKYGGRYFVTHDARMLSRKKEISGLLGGTIQIVTLRQFLEICGSYEIGG